MAELEGLRAWLLAALESRGWNQADLHRRSGLSESAVSHLFSGKSKGTRHDTQVQLAQAFGMTHAELVAAVHGRRRPPPEDHDTERAILNDPNLTQVQKEALLVHYRSYRRPR